jgi:hypothetical protein
MRRTITIEADDYDLPVNLQAVQKTAAMWNGQAVELTLKLMFGLPPVSRTPRLGVMMELEVCHGSQAIYAGVQG